MLRMDYATLSTVLAALRHFQANRDSDDLKQMTHFDDVAPLTDDEIDQLCEHMSCGGDAPEPDDVWTDDPDHSRLDWGNEAKNNETNLGYWEWVAHRKESAEDDIDAIDPTDDNETSSVPDNP